MATWQSVSTADTLKAGETYRLVNVVKAPYNEVVKTAYRTQFQLMAWANDYTVKGFEFDPPMFTAHTNDLAPWSARMVFTPIPRTGVVQAGMDPRALLALAATIIAGALALVLVSSKLEHLVTTTGQTVKDTVVGATAPVFNPAVLILAFGVLALFMLRKGG